MTTATVICGGLALAGWFAVILGTALRDRAARERRWRHAHLVRAGLIVAPGCDRP